MFNAGNLSSAIVQMFNSDSTLRSLVPGGIRYGRFLEETEQAYPYAEINVMCKGSTCNSGYLTVSNYIVTLAIYSNSSIGTTQTIGNKLGSLLDFTQINTAFSNVRVMEVVPTVDVNDNLEKSEQSRLGQDVLISKNSWRIKTLTNTGD